ncbi:MAG: hypothetical protein FWH20_10745 [Oscillospiraceae bacterium]|nr:hypothetical protein [Oscillospiraceae bacterium]
MYCCCLCLNGVLIRHADEIKNNFDPANLRGYYLGGSLIPWLKANGGAGYAAKLEGEYCGGVNRRLREVFGVTEILEEVAIAVNTAQIPAIHSRSGSFTTSYSGSFTSSGSGSGSRSGSGSSSGQLGYGLDLI